MVGRQPVALLGRGDLIKTLILVAAIDRMSAVSIAAPRYARGVKGSECGSRFLSFGLREVESAGSLMV